MSPGSPIRTRKTRCLFATSSYYLYALAPGTGQPVEQFGDHGRDDLRQDLGRDPATLGVFLTSPGIVYQDLLITGFRTGYEKFQDPDGYPAVVPQWGHSMPSISTPATCSGRSRLANTPNWRRGPV